MLNIQENIILAPYTTFRIGGSARYFTEVKSEEELIEALNYAKDNSLEFFILGGGSNLLVSDKGFDGLVIKFKIQSSKFKAAVQNSKLYSIECWAGNSLASLVNFSAENSLTNLEWAAGIQGTVGGSVRGNAGAYGGSIGDVIESVRVLKISNLKEVRPLSTSTTKRGRTSNKFQITNYKLHDCKFGYRSSIFKENPNLIILSVKIKLKHGDKAEIENKIKNIITQRTAKQPRGASAGSFFVNPVVADEKLRREFEKETGAKLKGERMPAGWLIQHLDLGGKRIGGAMVSSEHGNWIVNTGTATAEDVIMLVSIIKQKVRNKLGVQLKEEVRYLGF